MSRQIQGQQQKVIINLAPKPKRKKRKKKKSKAVDSKGDFRTALARSAYIQRGIGGLGFNQGGGGGLPFRKNIDANAVKLNARSFFEGERREQPNLRSLAELSADPNPADTSIGSVRGNSYTPRYLDENASFTTIFGSSRGGGVREDEELSESSYYQPSESSESSESSYLPQSSSGYSASISDFDTTEASVAESVVADEEERPARTRRRNQEIQEAEYMGAEDTRRQEDLYTVADAVRITDPSARARVEREREARREALNSVVATGTTLGGAEEGSATASLSAPSVVATETDTGELLTIRPTRPPLPPTPIDKDAESDNDDD